MIPGLTLAQQLAQLEDPTPIEIDPENEYIDSRHNEELSESSEDHYETGGRAHYLDVDRSKLRSLHESLNEPKYAGQKIKRQLGEDVSSDDEEKQEEPEQSSGSSAHSEEERDRASQSDHDSDMEDTKEKEDTEELNNVLKKAKESDQAKGRAISKQMAIWDTLLDARIRLQKSSSLCNTLPAGPNFLGEINHIDVERSVHAFVEEVLQLSNDLVELREALINASSNSSDAKTPPRKRRRIEVPSAQDGVDSLSRAVNIASDRFVEDENEYHPQLLSILQKWSAKIHAVTPSNLLPSSRNSFRTNRNAHLKSVTQLIEESLSDPSKLIARTRVRRGDPRIDWTSDQAMNTVDIEGKSLKEEVELFDDSDFYQQLLRDVIDGQRANGYTDEDMDIRPKKVKKQVDTRASKGRKLRYEVHEKIANFMVPVPTIVEGWHEEKIDELFASLLGKRVEAYEDREVISSGRSALTRDGFRIYG